MKPCNHIISAVQEILGGGFAPVETVVIDDLGELRIHFWSLPTFGPLVLGIQAAEPDPNIYLMRPLGELYAAVCFLGKR